MAESLDIRQEKFCLAYVGECNGNGTKAAIAAGYTNNENSAAVQASRLLRNVNIISRIKALRHEALVESGYDKSKVRELIMRRLTGIISTNVTDVVHISPGKHDPNRAEVLDAIAEQNGGQRVLDFGDTIIVPTTCLTEEVSGAIKKIKVIQPTKEADGGVEVEMNDVIAASKLLAEIAGLKDGDTTVNVNIDAASILSEVEARKAVSGSVADGS